MLSLCPDMWNLPGPEVEAMPPSLAGGFLTTGHQGGLRAQTLDTDCPELNLGIATYWMCGSEQVTQHLSALTFSPAKWGTFNVSFIGLLEGASINAHKTLQLWPDT